MNKQIHDALTAFFNREKSVSYGKLKVESDEKFTKLYYTHNWILCLYKNKNILLADYFPETVGNDILTIFKKAGIYTTIRKDYLNLLGVNLWFNNSNIEDVWIEPTKWTENDTLFIHVNQELKNNEGETIFRNANIEVLPRDIASELADTTPNEVVIKQLRIED